MYGYYRVYHSVEVINVALKLEDVLFSKVISPELVTYRITSAVYINGIILKVEGRYLEDIVSITVFPVLYVFVLVLTFNCIRLSKILRV